MIRRSTVVYLVLLLVLAGAYYYLKTREKPADIALTAEPSPEASYLFTSAEGTPSSIRIKSKAGSTVEVTRGADKAWALTQPTEAKAEQGAAEAAASQIATLRILDKVNDVDPKIVGLDIPEYVLTLKFTSGERTVDIGVLTPTESGYYVRDTAGKIVIVSKDSIDSLISLLDNPPYLETPTPLSPAGTLETGTPPSETATP
ncbi:MAG TPA: DUF4340 domain-containing protein [Anaerolineales bacterium]|nr:DUF4340 domain-containing protein [Anaerolineales bacterium]HLO28981.1 DUF4340 domain-containing protein [Anaerolineales bacterium]